MSGRSGYAKSDHPLLGLTRITRGSRTPPHLLPDWRLRFELPPAFALGVTPGPYPGVLGVHIKECGRVEIAGKVRSWVEATVACFIRRIALGGLASPLSVVFERGDEPGPTLSGPIRKGQRLAGTITYDGREVRLTIGRSIRVLSPFHVVSRSHPRNGRRRYPTAMD